MFDFFRRMVVARTKASSDKGAWLTLGPVTFANTVLKMIQEMDLSSRAHLVVAYVNVSVTFGECLDLAAKAGKTFTVDDFLAGLQSHSLSEIPQKSEALIDAIHGHRGDWFWLAALVKRLEDLTEQGAPIEDTGGQIWALLVQEVPRLKILLTNDIVWKAEEKSWFDRTQPDRILILSAINALAPPVFANTNAVKRVAGRCARPPA